MPRKPFALSPAQARHIWIGAQRLDGEAPFGQGPEAVHQAVRHLGYVQIDTINVVERCHHHILYSRIPEYRRSDLAQAQSADKSVFEYWTHALSYVAIEDLPYFLPAMKQYRLSPRRWFGSVTPEEIKPMLKRLREDGPLSIRDIGDDVLVSKNHPWASRKPSKRVLELMFYQGLLAIAARQGMVKTYDLFARHFAFETLPRPATDRQVNAYVLERALRSQGVVSLDSICHLDAPRKSAIGALIESYVRQKRLVPVTIDGLEKQVFWASPDALAGTDALDPYRTHILSPFDPLVIQRKRLKLFFGYEHLFEAYVPAPKRKMGYFALPVLQGDRMVAAVDIKADRSERKLLIQQWTWLAEVNGEGKAAIDAALERFARFQFDA